MWQSVVDFLNDADRKCHALDLPGFGENNVCVSSIEEMSRYVFRYLDKHHIQNAVIVGHSMGGYVALEMLHNNAERIDGIGLVHSHAAPDSPEKRDNREKLIQFVHRNGTAHFLKQFAKELIDAHETNQVLLQQTYDLVKNTRPDAVISASKAMISRKDHRATLKTEKPVLWVIGKEDKFMPYESVVEQSKICPNATVHILNGVGHLCMFEVPKQTEKVLQHFLDEIVELLH